MEILPCPSRTPAARVHACTHAHTEEAGLVGGGVEREGGVANDAAVVM